MSIFQTTIQDGGRIVIPASLRRELQLKKGSPVTLSYRDGTIEITTQMAALTRLQTMVAVKFKGRKLADELIAERRAEAKRERRP